MTRPAVRLFDALLRVHPRSLRDAHGAEMRQAFVDALEAARSHGHARVTLEALAEYADLVRSGAAARWASAGRRRGRAPVPSGGLHVIPTAIEWQRAARRLIAHPGYAALVVAALALGIGANTVVFSVADATLFRGAPYPNGSRIFEVMNFNPEQKFSYPGLSPAAIHEWRGQADVFDRVEGFSYATFVVTGGTEPDSIAGVEVTPGLFDLLGVRPVLGRAFEPGEGQPGRRDVAILSDGLWRARFGADRSALGRVIVLNDQPYRIVGVMPPGFRFPAEPQRVWVPTTVEGAGAPARIDAIATLRPGVTKELAQQRLDAAAAGLQASRPLPGGWHVQLMQPRATFVNDTTRQAIRILLGAVVLVLLIACANVANLFFAQALGRQRELAVRSALGATRWRLVRELLAESVLLSAIGGIAGVSLAWWGVDAAAALAPEQLTRFSAVEIGIDGRVLLFTGAITVLTGALFGVMPAFRASRPAAHDWLKGRTSEASASHGRLRGALVVAEVALSVVLLVGAVLLIRSFVKLTSIDLGFDGSNLLTVTYSLPADRYPMPAREAFFRDLAQAVRGMPGVRAVTTANGAPPSGGTIRFSQQVEAEGGATPEQKLQIIPDTSVAPDFFHAIGIPILEGRGLAAGDPSDVVVISRSMAEYYWPGRSAVGRRFRMSSRGPWITVVGVAGEVTPPVSRTGHEQPFELYSPLWAAGPPTAGGATMRVGPRSFSQATLIVRADDPMALVALIKAATWAIDPDQPVGRVALVEHLLGESLREQRFALVLMTAFAVLAVALAAAGLYAVLAHLVTQRRHEIGIRMALGADAADVLRLIAGRGLALTLAGLVLGTGVSLALVRYIRTQLYEVSPHDPASFAAVAAALTAVALLACWVPARRALRIDPAVALRAE